MKSYIVDVKHVFISLFWTWKQKTLWQSNSLSSTVAAVFAKIAAAALATVSLIS